MTAHRTYVYAGQGDEEDPASADLRDPAMILGAVREDIRQTLRTGWIDPALDAASAYPVFFTAAWSAMRPNVGKSFLLLAKSVRSAAADSVRSWVQLPDLRKRLDGELSQEELGRIEGCVRASYMVLVKTQFV